MLGCQAYMTGSYKHTVIDRSTEKSGRLVTATLVLLSIFVGKNNEQIAKNVDEIQEQLHAVPK